MLIHLISDIHLEFKNFVLNSKGYLLVIAGDLGPVAQINSKKYKEFLKNVSGNYKHVIFVPGNHEYYGTTIDNAEKMIREHAGLFPNVHRLQCEKLAIDDLYEFYGCTLWSDPKGKVWKTNDGQNIKNMTIPKFKSLHEEHKKWLEEQLSVPKKNEETKRIVVTHYLPSYKCIHEKYTSYGDISNSFYASNCDDLVDKSDIWLFGHTHTPMEIKVNDIKKMICHPKGYPWESPDIYGPKVIEI
jgi:predicted phosphodiesterase